MRRRGVEKRNALVLPALKPKLGSLLAVRWVAPVEQLATELCDELAVE